MSHILIIDDNPLDRMVARQTIHDMGHDTREAGSGEEGIEFLSQNDYGLVLLDFMMPGMSGVETLKEIKKITTKLPVVLITATKDSAAAIEAMKFGAHDYLTKPVNREQLTRIAEEALLAHERMMVEVELEDEISEPLTGDRILGRSPVMLDVYKDIGRVAGTDASVLITGESGTGKELVARAIYQHSDRADREFVTVNCAALTESLLESELFGHEKGSFTGAEQRHIGKFERANGGVIFLDEIGEMSPVTQTKLLRALQEKHFERVGGSEVIKCDVRVLAATNRDLQKEVEEDRFRQDLYYRLNVVRIHLPPLRDRKEDIPELCEYLLRSIADEIGKPAPALSVDATLLLLAHEWPGNVRELRNVLAHASVRTTTRVIMPDHLELSPTGHGSPGEEFVQLFRSNLDDKQEGIYEAVLEELELKLIRYALERTGNNQVQATKLLGISRNMLRRRVESFGL